MKKEYSILIGGQAGQGSRKAGLIIAKLLNQLGYYIFIYDEYQSLIKGGHNFSIIRASEEKISAHKGGIDFLLALDKTTVEKHKKDLKENGYIVYNSEKIEIGEGIGLPLDTIVKELEGSPIMTNTALISSFAKIIGIDWQIVEKVLKEEFNKKIDLNLKIAETAFNKSENIIKIEKKEAPPKPLLTGNEAISLGAVKAGLDLYIAYPMTPASGILHYLAAHQKDFNIGVSQLENEVGIVNSAVGAVYAGARTMIGTSGGGFALMTEGLSLAAMSEAPILVVESQRSGPATGVPTYNSQSDLLFSINAGHGDFERFVIAPADADQSFIWAAKALNLCWKYQTPSILLVDKQVSESTFNFDKELQDQINIEKGMVWDNQGEYKRYRYTDDGISPLAFPGENKAIVKGTSYEHDEFGITAEEDEDEIKKMNDKRIKKFEKMREEVENMESIKIYGNKDSDTAVITWGSSTNPAMEAAKNLGVKLVQVIVVSPFPKKQVKEALKGVSKIISVEANVFGQLEKLLNCNGIKVDDKILRYDSRPFLPEQIEEKISKKI